MAEPPFRLRDVDPFRRRNQRYAGRAWVTPHRGVRIPTTSADNVDARIAAAALVLPDGGALAGWAAARRHGDRWASGLDSRGCALAVPAALPHHVRLRRNGIAPVNGVLEPDDVWMLNGVATTSPDRTGFDEARLLPYGEAVAALDSLLACGATDLTRLRLYVQHHPGMKGVPQARQVLEVASPYAESRQESRMRLCWLAVGFDQLVVNATILDEHGEFVGRVDLLDEEAGLVGEYQGDTHRDQLQYRKDLRRKRRLESLGLIVSEAGGGDLRPGSGYTRDLVAARRRGLDRDRRLDRWQLGLRRSTPQNVDDWWAS
ncbi:MAG: hypothetical protein ABWZ26_02310 [Candidatus Nanopelagicales bacterium]